MPVVVTGASGVLGRRAAAAFLRKSPDVRAVVCRRDQADSLRALGAKVAVGGVDDVENLQTVMADAHTVCHLLGGLDESDDRAYERLNLGSVRAALEAADTAGVRRFLFLSCPGASPAAANPYRRYKGLAEEAVRESGLQYAILRCTLVYGPGSRWLDQIRRLARRWPSTVIGSGRQMMAPVFVDDVAAVLAAADDRARSVSGTWGLEGPQRVTGEVLADLVAGPRRPRVHLRGGGMTWLARLQGYRAGPTALEVLAGDCLADAPDAAAEFLVPRTDLREGLSRSWAAWDRE